MCIPVNHFRCEQNTFIVKFCVCVFVSMCVCIPLNCTLMKGYYFSLGAMFSFSASVEAVCILLAGLLFNGLYPFTLATVAGMPFVVMATLMLVVFILMQ